MIVGVKRRRVGPSSAANINCRVHRIIVVRHERHGVTRLASGFLFVVFLFRMIRHSQSSILASSLLGGKWGPAGTTAILLDASEAGRRPLTVVRPGNPPILGCEPFRRPPRPREISGLQVGGLRCPRRARRNERGLGHLSQPSPSSLGVGRLCSAPLFLSGLDGQ